jgi:hypothetical protein
LKIEPNDEWKCQWQQTTSTQVGSSATSGSMPPPLNVIIPTQGEQQAPQTQTPIQLGRAEGTLKIHMYWKENLVDPLLMHGCTLQGKMIRLNVTFVANYCP